MTLNRLYNFTPGQVIQSSQVNAEFDQIISSLNTYCVDANFTSNNVVSDGDIVCALSALDSFIGNNPVSKNYLKNAVINLYNHNGRTLKLYGSSSNPIIISKGTYCFYEESEVSLDLTSSYFNDIYVEEDTSKTPIITGTKRIKLIAKSADQTPYSTTASSGQHLIGCAYVYNSKVMGIHSLEEPNNPSYHEGVWGLGDEFNFQITSTTLSYSTKKCYVPVFVDSTILYHIKYYFHKYGSAACDAINFYFYVKRNGAVDHYTEERIPPLTVSSAIYRSGRTTVDRVYNITPGVYTFEFGGMLGNDDTTPSPVEIERLYSHFQVYPKSICFDTH
ncbi:MAG: hypothetical protein AB1782_09080 [Cyanobacteriota bacterium]